MFDTFVIVDWSAANQPKTGRDSIWICCRTADGAERVENPATRHQARELLGELFAAAMGRGGRVLAGFDFPFGYPVGFAKRLGLNGTLWRSVWDEIAMRLVDDSGNANNRFAVAAEFNRRVSADAFPFWGCPPAQSGPHLGPRHHRGHQDGGLRERRLIDEYMAGAQPCWKLLGAGSVGGQVLTGIPVVRALRDDRRWQAHARVWPFETGLRPPDDARIAFAEVWPSWWDWKPTRTADEVNDRAQVRHVAAFFAERTQAGELDALFAGAPELSAEQRRQVETEEAWTLGVTAPRRPTKSPSPAAEERVGVRGCDRPHPASADASASLSRGAGKGKFSYLRDPAAIYRRSFAIIRAEADLSRFAPAMRPLALRLAHAAGDTAILDDLLWSRGAAGAGRRALATGKPVLVDSQMVAAGIIRDRLPAKNDVVCTLADPAVPSLAAKLGTTRSAAAVELWRPHLDGAVIAIGNAPTALFHLLEMIAAGAPKPALVLGFPVGFVGAAEAKAALMANTLGLPFIALAGRRGGSALAAAAVNALAAR